MVKRLYLGVFYEVSIFGVVRTVAKVRFSFFYDDWKEKLTVYVLFAADGAIEFALDLKIFGFAIS